MSGNVKTVTFCFLRQRAETRFSNLGQHSNDSHHLEEPGQLESVEVEAAPTDELQPGQYETHKFMQLMCADDSPTTLANTEQSIGESSFRHSDPAGRTLWLHRELHCTGR